MNLIMIPIAMGFILWSMIIEKWQCGGLFDSCYRHYKTMSVVLIILFISGFVCLGITFIIDLLSLCQKKFRFSLLCTTNRLIFLSIGTISTFVGILYYTIELNHQYSYLLIIAGTTLAIQTLLLNLSTYKCTCRTVEVAV